MHRWAWQQPQWPEPGHWQIKGTQRVKEPCEEVVLQELQGQEAVFHSEAGALAGVL